jgi:hypothetical protein|tara:strand:+ start:1347 stop:3329 length:1983 start_codon:yes stop_codon:yes gene_type:complete
MAPRNPKEGKNPANRDSQLFRALTRLFSGPIVSYRSESGRKIRKQHLDKFSTRFKSASGQQFKKQSYNPLDTIAANAIANQQRSERYMDFDQMEYMPELASSLDIYADEMTTFSALSPMLNIKCRNDEIKAVLNILYHNIMNLEHNLFGWCRTMCKYGDLVLYLDIDDEMGIQSTISIPLQEVERLEGLDATNPNYVQYQWNSAGMTFENWQVAHFRILGNDKYAPYGTSVLEPVRRIWRQLTLMEDAMMAYRIVRSSERKVFKIDVGAIPPQEVEQYMQNIVTKLKRHTIVNKDTGRIDLRYNPMSIEEDYYIPVRAGSVTDIQSIAGGQNTTAIDDVKYLRDKMFSGLKIPQSYLTMGEGATEDKTTLATKDIRFARTIQRLQRSVIHELEKVGIIHLYTLGYRGEDLLNFKLALNNPSKIAELQELEHWKTKFDIAASATEGYFSRRWVADNIFGMSHEEFLRNQREQYYDRKHDTALEGVAEAVSDIKNGSGLDLGGGEEGGLDLGGADEGGELDLGGDEGGDEGEDDSPLLAAPPGSRNSPRLAPSLEKRARAGKKYLTKGSKGKTYQKVATDKRPQGARTRNYASIPTPEMNTYRTNNLGASELRSLSRGIYEEQDPNYLRDQKEEQALLEVNSSIKMLIESLKTKEMENSNEE